MLELKNNSEDTSPNLSLTEHTENEEVQRMDRTVSHLQSQDPEPILHTGSQGIRFINSIAGAWYLTFTLIQSQESSGPIL